MNDSLTRWLLLGLFALFFVVRAYHHRKAVKDGGAIEYREEAVMLEQFGDAYQAYMQRTGRLFPRLSK